jgi:hypothetical protein
VIVKAGDSPATTAVVKRTGEYPRLLRCAARDRTLRTPACGARSRLHDACGFPDLGRHLVPRTNVTRSKGVLGVLGNRLLLPAIRGCRMQARGRVPCRMLLPGATFAIVDERKVRDYLLSLQHPRGRSKAVVFIAFGYRRERWAVLRDDLLALAPTMDVERVHSAEGDRYVGVGRLRSPSGRTLAITVVWVVVSGVAGHD